MRTKKYDKIKNFNIWLAGFLLVAFSILKSCSSKSSNEYKLTKPATCCVSKTTGRIICGADPDMCSDWLPHMRDKYGRYVFMHGINLSGSNKFPVNEDPCTFKIDGVPTYVGKPFPEEKADEYFRQIRNLGFNSVRFLISVEGVMPETPARFDERYLDYIEKMIQKAYEYDIYVLLDSHTDAVFSRFFIARFNDTESPIVRRIRQLLSAAGGGAGLTGLIPIPETIGALIPNGGRNKCKGNDIDFPYNNAVRGNMFPRWAIEAIFPERNLDSKIWGYPRITIFLRNFISKPENWDKIVRVISKFDKNTGELLRPLREEVLDFLEEGIKKFPVDVTNMTFEEIISNTTDMLPLTNWGVNTVLSLDVQRAWAAFFAGRDVFPDLEAYDPVDGKTKNIQDFLQDAYARMWNEVAKRAAKYPNVIGYDLMNEPSGFFLILTLAAAFVQIGSKDGIVNLLETIFADRRFAEDFVDVLTGIGILPPVTENNREIIKRVYGFDKANLFALIGLNYGFDRGYILPFHEKMGKAIEEADPDAIIFVERTISSIETLLTFISPGGGESFFDIPYTRPKLKQVVYAPHWYPDIYPFPGFNSPYRVFQFEEKRAKAKEYATSIYGMISTHRKYMGNVPVVLGEFGTYFTLSTRKVDFDSSRGYKVYNPKTDEEIEVGNIWQGAVINARNEDFLIPNLVLNDLFEAVDSLNLQRILWCWSWENDDYRGEGWNSENFSIVEPVTEQNCQGRGIKNPQTCEGDPYIAKVQDGIYLVPRGYKIYSRTHPDFTSGKIKSLKFYTYYHFFDPEKDVVNKIGEFEMEMESKETDHPTVIYIPYYIYYPQGFYVWVSDGFVVYDHEKFKLYWYPEEDSPEFIHKIKIRGILEGQENENWDYFIKEDRIISRKGR
ncbi:MAG: glycoside hydrolase family 5 protein [Candidatus Calescibacterium sp.]|nr:glycoside hydrolase family 5 protein [Candidatus Calescibacterium sp.]MDW8087780.1 cellulase family glycosylhydrolase [Candidatus Calescibacterium sp.]